MINLCDSFDMPDGNLLAMTGVINHGTVRPETSGGQ
jgi:hypothetical protein